MKKRGVIVTVLFVLAIAMTSVPAMAQSDEADYRDEALQQAAQNPVADMISIPLQNNFNFGVGPNDKMQYVGNVQPVIPFHATENWNVITRTIVPFVYQPELAPGVGDIFGLSDIQFSAFLSPAKPARDHLGRRADCSVSVGHGQFDNQRPVGGGPVGGCP